MMQIIFIAPSGSTFLFLNHHPVQLYHWHKLFKFFKRHFDLTSILPPSTSALKQNALK